MNASARHQGVKDCSFRTYEPGDEAAINAMFNEVFHEKRSIESWNWRYQENPAGSPCIALGLMPDQMFGAHYAGYPVRLMNASTGSQRLLSFHAGDVMTRPQARGFGIGASSILVKTTDTFKQCLDQRGVDFYYGFNTAVARKFGRMFQGYADGGPVSYWQLGVSEAWSQTSRLPALLSRRGGTPRRMSSAGPELDKLLDDTAAEYAWMTERSAQYLRWRYFQRPERDYIVIGLYRFGRLLGWSVFWRLGKALRWGDALFRTAVKPSQIRSLLMRAIQEAGPGIELIEAWFSPWPHWWCNRLEALGFQSMREPNDLSLQLIPIAGRSWPQDIPGHLYYSWADSDLF